VPVCLPHFGALKTCGVAPRARRWLGYGGDLKAPRGIGGVASAAAAAASTSATTASVRGAAARLSAQEEEHL
jgi:hypothetical protein